jgi:hypothetical protein
MAAGRAEAVGVGQVVVEVEMDRVRQVARRPRLAPRSGLPEGPPTVDDSQRRVAGADSGEQLLGIDQG